MYDLKITSNIHDFQFSGNLDLSTVDGNDLVNQRIITRLVIEKGTFIYDPFGTLGSSLKTALSQPTLDGQIQAAEQLIREALQPMDDIIITNVNVEAISVDPTLERVQLSAIVQWAPIVVGSNNQAPLISGDINSVPISF